MPVSRLLLVFTLLPLTLPRALGSPGRVTRTADMHAPRAAHTATTLPDGRVLIAGGFAGTSGDARAAELFDARTGRTTPVPLRHPRHSHTATLMPDGRVLITGGYVQGGRVTTAAELFDPRTQQSVAAGALTTPRAGHIAVSLADGRVLIAGGVGNDWSFLSTAELYDPRTGRFTPTAAMREERESHVGVLLPDGRVLVIGGHTGRRAAMRLHASTEVFDPRTLQFTPGPSLRIRRHKHDAIRLSDGRVLVLGGSDERDDRGAYTSTELLEPSRERFADGPSLNVPRYKLAGSSVLLRDGRVLVAGGHGRAELFDPATNSFALIAQADTMAGQFAATAPLDDGRVLVTGGYGNGTGPRASMWLFTAGGRP